MEVAGRSRYPLVGFSASSLRFRTQHRVMGLRRSDWNRELALHDIRTLFHHRSDPFWGLGSGHNNGAHGVAMELG